ncbi:GDSL-type esterase/lipase family protein, partial [Raoultella ornithinolytica]|uniref:GDSL-type esterase/lipase family protein n=1 Tax=Raoultella ornithinolytica TaxID=54291 RepID=UPI001BD3E6CE
TLFFGATNMAYVPPVGQTTDPDIFLENVKRADRLISGPAETVPDRGGEPLDTWRLMMEKNASTIKEAQDSITILGLPFTTREEAQAAADEGKIPVGAVTWARNAGDASLADELINNGGTLEATGRKMASQSFVESVDSFAREQLKIIESLPIKIPLIIDDSANPRVAVWVENGDLNSIPLHQDLVDQVQEGMASEAFVSENLASPMTAANKTVLIMDNSPQPRAAAWQEDGLWNSIPLHPDITGPIVDEALSKIPQQVVSSGKTLWLYRAKKSKLDNSVSTNLKIGFSGDSWAENRAIPQQFATYLQAKYGKSGEGWLQLNVTGNSLLNDVTLTKTGWTVYDASGTTANPPFPTSMDGQYCYASGITAVMSLSNLFATSVRIFYYDGTGTFRYIVNGGSPVVVSGGGTNVITSVLISGLAIGSATTVNIDLSGNSGTVVIYGFYSTGSGTGVEINKMGNGSITAGQYVKTLPYLSQTASFVNPDLLVLIIGTNDYRLNESLDIFKSSLTLWVQSWQAACPDSGIILVAPPQTNSTGDNPLSEFKNIMKAVAYALNVEFYSMYDFLNVPYAKSNAQGLWSDALHLNTNGARFLMNQINDHFMEIQ